MNDIHKIDRMVLSSMSANLDICNVCREKLRGFVFIMETDDSAHPVTCDLCGGKLKNLVDPMSLSKAYH